MPMIKVDGQDYDTDSFSEEAKKQLQALQFIDVELARLMAQTAVFKTARLGYVNALKKLLPAKENPFEDGIIKFG